MEFPKARGVKTWKPSVVGYGYFLELPNVRLKAAKVRFVQLELGILSVLYNLSERKKKENL